MTLPPREDVPGFEALGLVAFTTTRDAGDFNLASRAAGEGWPRWIDLAATLRGPRLAFAHQVHGVRVVEHGAGWEGILRLPDADGHVALAGPMAMAVTLADCVPVFIGHPSGAAALLHSGWKGTVGRIVRVAIDRLVASGLRAGDLLVHCGPAICGRCYEVSPEVYGQVTGRQVAAPTPVDLRARIASDARESGVQSVTVSRSCTRCDNDRFYSHRCGDAGRQVGVLARP